MKFFFQKIEFKAPQPVLTTDSSPMRYSVAEEDSIMYSTADEYDDNAKSWIEEARVDEVEVGNFDTRPADTVHHKSDASRRLMHFLYSFFSFFFFFVYSFINSVAVFCGVFYIKNRLFEKVKDQIYRGAANMISLYESEPYFLLQVLRGIQNLDSTYLRQRLLISLDEILEEKASSSVQDTMMADGEGEDCGDDNLDENNAFTSEAETALNQPSGSSRSSSSNKSNSSSKAQVPPRAKSSSSAHVDLASHHPHFVVADEGSNSRVEVCSVNV